MSVQPETHVMEAGYTYWVHTRTGPRFRMDLSTPGEVWLAPPPTDDGGFAADVHDWFQVLDARITVRRGAPLVLSVAAQSGPRPWASAEVVALARSSKSILTTPVEWTRDSD